jgi:hypothetical protein
MGRADRSHDDTDDNGACRRNGKLLQNYGWNGNGRGGKKLCPDKPEYEFKDKTRGMGKGKLCHKQRFDFNSIVKALTAKEQQRHRDEQLCYHTCHKLGLRLSKCPMLQPKSLDKADKHYLW